MDDGAAHVTPTQVAVIGAGWAGCAAAVKLAQAGAAVTLFETAGVAGGRARRVMRGRLALDNGQHLMLGAYTETLRLLALVHGGDGETGRIFRMPLAVEPLARGRDRLALRALRWPAPLGLAAGLCTARGLSIAERWALIRWWTRLARSGFECEGAATVADLLRTCPEKAARELWRPLCLAALNTPPERACARTFANVLSVAFASNASHSDFLLPTVDLSAVFPDAAARYVERHGGALRLRTRASIAALEESHVVVRTGDEEQRFDAAVVAVGPHQLAHALDALPAFDDALKSAGSLAYEPIATVWLGYAAPVPLNARIARLDDAPGQWVFDRNNVLQCRAAGDTSATGQLVAVVISASGSHDALDRDSLARACDAQLRRLAPAWPALQWWQVVVEQRASYACVPGRARPASIRPHPRVVLAGDWVDAELPATLEAAVRTGVRAAQALEPIQRARAERSSHAQKSVPSFAR